MSKSQKIGIIGTGNLGGALARGITRAGRDVRSAGKKPAEVRDTATWADIGFDAIDAGPLSNARLLEPLGYLNIQLGYVLGVGTQIGLQPLRR